MSRKELVQAVAVCAELTGTDFTQAAARVMVDDLSDYPHDQVIAALSRCRRELKGRLTLAEILSRLDDGRPGPEEAWAMIPMNDGPSVVWTDEMRDAFGVAWPLIKSDQIVTARMAFLERYRVLVATARAEKRPVVWTPSLGWDVAGRAAAIHDAVERKRLSPATAAKLLPNSEPITVPLPQLKQIA